MRGYCRNCKKTMEGKKKDSNVASAVLLTIVTAGIYLPFYLFYRAVAPKNKCLNCGLKLEK